MTCITNILLTESGITRDRLIGMSKYQHIIINMRDTRKYHLQKKRLGIIHTYMQKSILGKFIALHHNAKINFLCLALLALLKNRNDLYQKDKQYSSNEISLNTKSHLNNCYDNKILPCFRIQKGVVGTYLQKILFTL